MLEHPFPHGMSPARAQRLADYRGEALGGPAVYSSRYGGQLVRAGLWEGSTADRSSDVIGDLTVCGRPVYPPSSLRGNLLLITVAAASFPGPCKRLRRWYP